MKFQIKALQGAEGIVSMVFDATDAADASTAGEDPRPERYFAPAAFIIMEVRATSRRARFPLALFAQELLALLEAGLTLVEAIEGLAEKESPREAHDVLGRLSDQLQQGRTLSQAHADPAGGFPPLYVATVRATERSGDLPDALRRYIAYQAQLDTVRKKIVSASIYPGAARRRRFAGAAVPARLRRAEIQPRL